MNFIDICSGIGGFRTGLERNGHNCIAFAEIDKYAIKSYKAIYDTENEVELGDITTMEDSEWEQFKGSCDMIVGGTPCQSFSIAGKRLGFEDTRGTVFFSYVNAIKQVQPKYFLFENVKGLMSHDKGNTIKVILKAFDEVGYDLDFEIFNSKYYGVPQNRERIYIVGVRKDLSDKPFKQVAVGKKKMDLLKAWATCEVSYKQIHPTLQTEVTTRLVDVLENEVDEKYYLSEEKTKKLTLNADLGGKLNMYDYNERDRVHSIEKVSPTLNTMQGGDRQPKIAVREATKQGYTIAGQGDSVNVSYPTSKTRRGRVGKQVAQTLQAGEVNQGVVMGGDFDDKEIERNTVEILRALQQEIGEEEITKWRFRILDTFQQEEILRQDVYEKGLDIEQDEKKFERNQQSHECEVKNTTFDEQERMREMSINKEFRCSSHGRGSIQQFARELTSIMQKLSHETSQEKNLQDRKSTRLN